MNTEELLATTDHKTILEWTRSNQGIPVMMKTKNAMGVKEIAIDFSAGSANDDESIAVTWEEWLRIFDKRKLVLLYNVHIDEETQPYYRLESKNKMVSAVVHR